MQESIFTTLFILIIVLFACGCNRVSDLPPLRLKKWVENPKSGLNKVYSGHNLSYQLQYLPIAYLIAKSSYPNDITANDYDLEYEELKNMQYYTLTIQNNHDHQPLLKHNLSSRQEYFERVAYYSSDMQNDITLVDGNDSLACVLFHFERTYDLAPYSRFQLAFENKNKNTADKKLIFHDRMISDKDITFEIEKSALYKIPNLKIN